MASEWAAQVIGINYYPGYTTLKPLTAAAEDAEKIAGQLEQYGYRSFRTQRLPKTANQKGETKIDPQGAVKISSIVTSLNPAAFATTLVLAVIVPYSSTTLAQAPGVPRDANPQPGCLSGYPDGTYQGDRPVTRYEFAAGLNACLHQVNQLIPINRADLATRADFEALIKRQRELNEQLRELNRRVGIPPAHKP